MRVVVVGGKGSLGRLVVSALRPAGHDITVTTRRVESAPDDVKTVAATLDDPNTLAAVFKDADAVVHTAGLANFLTHTKDCASVHVAGTENVANAARAAGVTRLVHITTANVSLYEGDRVHWNEPRDSRAETAFSHARSKRLAEEVLLASPPGDVGVISLRVPFLWGPSRTGRLHALESEARAHGGVILPSTAAPFFATLHEDNFASAVRAAIDAPRERDGEPVVGEAYYLSDEAISSAEEFFVALSRAMGLPSPRRVPNFIARLRARLAPAGFISPEELAERTFASLFDTQRARNRLGWGPHVNFEEAMKALV